MWATLKRHLWTGTVEHGFGWVGLGFFKENEFGDVILNFVEFTAVKLIKTTVRRETYVSIYLKLLKRLEKVTSFILLMWRGRT